MGGAGGDEEEDGDEEDEEEDEEDDLVRALNTVSYNVLKRRLESAVVCRRSSGLTRRGVVWPWRPGIRLFVVGRLR